MYMLENKHDLSSHLRTLPFYGNSNTIWEKNTQSRLSGKGPFEGYHCIFTLTVPWTNYCMKVYLKIKTNFEKKNQIPFFRFKARVVVFASDPSLKKVAYSIYNNTY